MLILIGYRDTRAEKLEEFNLALSGVLVLFRRARSIQVEFNYARIDEAIVNLTRASTIVEFYSAEVGRLGRECVERFEWWSAHAGLALNDENYTVERHQEADRLPEQVETVAEEAKRRVSCELQGLFTDEGVVSG